MSSPERKAAVELSPKIGVTVDVYTTFWHPDDSRIPLVLDKTKALSHQYVLVPLRDRLRFTSEDQVNWKKFGFHPSEKNTGLTGFLPPEEVPAFFSSMRVGLEADKTAKDTIREKLLPLLTPFGKASATDFTPPKGLPFSTNQVQGTQTGLNLIKVAYLEPSRRALETIDWASERGAGIILVHPEEISSDQPQKILFHGKEVEAHFHPSCRVVYEGQLGNDTMAYLSYALSKYNTALATELIDLLNLSSSPGVATDLPEEINWGGLEDFVPSETVREGFFPHYVKIKKILLDWSEKNLLGETHRLTSMELGKFNQHVKEQAVLDLETSLLVSRAVTKVVTRMLYFAAELIFINPALGRLPISDAFQDQALGIALLFAANGIVYLARDSIKGSVESRLEDVLNNLAHSNELEEKFLGVNLKAFASSASKDIANAEINQPTIIEMAATMAALTVALSAHREIIKAPLAPLIIGAATYLLEHLYLDREPPDKPKSQRVSLRNKSIREAKRALILIWPFLLSDLVKAGLDIPEIIAAGFTLGHISELLDKKSDTDNARKNIRTLNRILDNLSISLVNKGEAIRHNFRIINGENLEYYYSGNRKRYKRLDEAGAQFFAKTPKRFLLYDHYSIGRKDNNFVTDATLALAGGQVNILQIHNDPELSFILATLGEKFDHQGSALYRSEGRDFNIHELSNQFVHYFNCSPEEILLAENLFSDVYTSTIVSRLKMDMDNRFHVVFAREIDQANRIDLIRKYFKSTGMFDDDEKDNWDPKGKVSGSMAMRLKVAAAFLHDGVIILDDIYDRRTHTTREWKHVQPILDKISRFIASKAKRDNIVLLGINNSSELPRKIFAEENVLGKRYTVRKEKFVEVSSK